MLTLHKRLNIIDNQKTAATGRRFPIQHRLSAAATVILP